MPFQDGLPTPRSSRLKGEQKLRLSKRHGIQRLKVLWDGWASNKKDKPYGIKSITYGAQSLSLLNTIKKRSIRK